MAIIYLTHAPIEIIEASQYDLGSGLSPGRSGYFAATALTAGWSSTVR